jgi:membrane-associated protease RseP (regulator of RpoE activity)
MVTIPTKAVALALFMIVPPVPAPPAIPAPPPPAPAAPAPPATPRVNREVVVVDDDGVATFDSDDDPIVVRSEHGARRGFIGVRLMDLNPELRAHFGAPRDAGVMVSEVDADSPASKAGVAVGDIITAADGEKIASPGELSRVVRRKKAGETVKLDVSRDRSAKHLSVAVEERRTPWMDIGDLGELRGLRHLGPEIRARVMRDMDRVRPQLEMRRDRLEQKIDQMQKRLDELEKRLSKSKD